MTRQDLVWVGIRLLGVYFLALAALMVPQLLFVMLDVLRSGNANLAGVGQPVLVFALEVGLGCYLVKGGAFFSDLVLPRVSTNAKRPGA